MNPRGLELGKRFSAPVSASGRACAILERGMRGRLFIIVATIAVAAAAAAQPIRRGKISVLERPRVSPRAALRFCPITEPDTWRGTCYGGAPRVGDEVQLYNEQGYRGRGELVAVEASVQDTCGSESAWDVDYRAIETKGRIDPYTFGLTIAVFGMDQSSRGRGHFVPSPYTLSSPSGNPDEKAWLAFDADGDGTADVLVTAYQCSRTPPPRIGSKAAGGAVSPYCLDYWVRESRWRKVRSDVYFSCT